MTKALDQTILDSMSAQVRTATDAMLFPSNESLASMFSKASRFPQRDYVLAGSKGAVASLLKHAAPCPTKPNLPFADFTLFGMQIEIADIPKEKRFDWSGCRSPARAKRRHALGHPQRVKITEHDVMYLVNKAAFRMGLDLERKAVKMMMGGGA